jgi:hypothetical protein
MTLGPPVPSQPHFRLTSGRCTSSCPWKGRRCSTTVLGLSARSFPSRITSGSSSPRNRARPHPPPASRSVGVRPRGPALGPVAFCRARDQLSQSPPENRCVALRARACSGLRSRSVPPASLLGPLRVLRIPDAGAVVAPLRPDPLAAARVRRRGSSGGEPPRPSRMPSGGAEGIPHLPRCACADGAPPSSRP